MDPHHLDADLDADPDSACFLMRIRIADPDSDFLFDADPDPTFHLDADPDTDPSIQKKAQTLEKVLK